MTAPDSAFPRYTYLHVDVPANVEDEVSFQLWELGANGVETRDQATLSQPTPEVGNSTHITLIGHFDNDNVAKAASTALKPYPTCIQHVVGDGWQHEWKRFFHTARIGRNIVVRPPWEPDVATSDEIHIVIDPGMAFGTGTHETTQLVLQDLEARVHFSDPDRVQTVLDVGCGSGILAIAALKLGARKARCIDIDPLAVTASHENAQRNGVGTRLKASTTPCSRLRTEYPVVLANIESRILLPMQDTLMQRLAKGGTLILSGILKEEARDVHDNYAAKLGPGLIRTMGNWVSITYQR